MQVNDDIKSKTNKEEERSDRNTVTIAQYPHEMWTQFFTHSLISEVDQLW